MNRTLIKTLMIAGAIFITPLFQIIVKEFLPYPLNHINCIFIFVIWFVAIAGESHALWMTLPIAFLTEIFSASPFGLFTAALLLSVIATSRLLLNIFVSHSIYMIFLAGAIGIIIFRVCLLAFSFIFNRGFFLSSAILLDWFWEVLLTNIILSLLYLSAPFFIKRLKPAYIYSKK